MRAVDFVSRLKRFDEARKSLQEKEAAEELRREQQRQHRLRESLSKGFDHFNGGSDMRLRPSAENTAPRPMTAAAVNVSHFRPASTILTDQCPPEKLASRPLHVQDDQWVRMRGHRRHVLPERVVPAHAPGAAGARPTTAGPLLKPRTTIDPRPYAQPLTDGVQRPFLQPAASEKQSRAWLVAMQPLEIDLPPPPAHAPGSMEAWRDNGRTPLSPLLHTQQHTQQHMQQHMQQQQQQHTQRQRQQHTQLLPTSVPGRSASPPPRGLRGGALPLHAAALHGAPMAGWDGDGGGPAPWEEEEAEEEATEAAQAGGAREDPRATCARLLGELRCAGVAPPPRPAQRIASLELVKAALEGVSTALAERIRQVIDWELEMLRKGRSERALQGIRSMLPDLVLQFIHAGC